MRQVKLVPSTVPPPLPHSLAVHLHILTARVGSSVCLDGQQQLKCFYFALRFIFCVFPLCCAFCAALALCLLPWHCVDKWMKMSNRTADSTDRLGRGGGNKQEGGLRCQVEAALSVKVPSQLLSWCQLYLCTSAACTHTHTQTHEYATVCVCVCV